MAYILCKNSSTGAIGWRDEGSTSGYYKLRKSGVTSGWRLNQDNGEYLFKDGNNVGWRNKTFAHIHTAACNATGYDTYHQYGNNGYDSVTHNFYNSIRVQTAGAPQYLSINKMTYVGINSLDSWTNNICIINPNRRVVITLNHTCLDQTGDFTNLGLYINGTWYTINNASNAGLITSVSQSNSCATDAGGKIPMNVANLLSGTNTGSGTWWSTSVTFITAANTTITGIRASATTIGQRMNYNTSAPYLSCAGDGIRVQSGPLYKCGF